MMSAIYADVCGVTRLVEEVASINNSCVFVALQRMLVCLFGSES